LDSIERIKQDHQICLVEVDEPKHNPSYIPQIGIPEKEKFREQVKVRAIYHKATSPGFFGLIVLFFFMPFINIKCGGRTVSVYSGYDIVTGKEKGTNEENAHDFVGVRQSAYHQFEMAKENFKWKRQLKEDYEKYIDDAPYFEDDFSASEDFMKIPNKYSDISKDPITMRVVTAIGLLCAVIAFAFSFWDSLTSRFIQVILSLAGFINMFLLQFLVSITLPTRDGMQVYSNKLVTIEFAIGYWLVLFLFLGISIITILKIRWMKKWKAQQENRS
jgi:hypothetical protein